MSSSYYNVPAPKSRRNVWVYLIGGCLACCGIAIIIAIIIAVTSDVSNLFKKELSTKYCKYALNPRFSSANPISFSRKD